MILLKFYSSLLSNLFKKILINIEEWRINYPILKVEGLIYVSFYSILPFLEYYKVRSKVEIKKKPGYSSSITRESIFLKLLSIATFWSP